MKDAQVFRMSTIFVLISTPLACSSQHAVPDRYPDSGIDSDSIFPLSTVESYPSIVTKTVKSGILVALGHL